MSMDLTDDVSRVGRILIVLGCLFFLGGLVVYDRYVGDMVPLGGFYFIPLLVVAAFVPRWAIFLLAIAAAVTREAAAGSHGFSPQRLALYLIAFTGGSLFAGELVRNRRMRAELKRRTEDQ